MEEHWKTGDFMERDRPCHDREHIMAGKTIDVIPESTSDVMSTKCGSLTTVNIDRVVVFSFRSVSYFGFALPYTV